MPKRGSFAGGVGAETRRRMGSAVSQEEFRRWQAIWLAAQENRPIDEIAGIAGLAVTAVRWLHARCRKDGLSSLGDKPVGGRYRFNLSIDQDRELLADFFARASCGQVLIVAENLAAVSKLLGKPVHSSGIYKLLARHGWRKIDDQFQGGN